MCFTGIAVLLIVAGCHSSKNLPTVEQVDLKRYTGLWYDLAHLPQSFQDDCKCVTAEYILKGDKLEVVNTCVDKENDEVSTVKGEASVVEGSANAKLEVEFYEIFEGDYYILALEENYSYAMVGSPDRNSLWIIGRRPEPAAIILKEYLNLAEELGFDTFPMEYTDQSCHVEPIE